MRNTLMIAFALAASFAFAGGKPTQHKSTKPAVVLVIASNPAFPDGDIAAPDLATAEEEADALTSLDPICGSIPQLCAARAANTSYRIFYSDGTESTQ
jgi:hypothetical protein